MRHDSSRCVVGVDIGSNSFRMHVVYYDHGRMTLLGVYHRVVRLGTGIAEFGYLSADKIAQACECLRHFRNIVMCHYYGARLIAVATSAVRCAKNRHEFLERVEAILDTPVMVIDGQREAELIYRGACYAYPEITARRLVIDIGGGSTEMIVGHGTQVDLSHSMPIGCIAVTDRFFAKGILSERAFQSAKIYVQHHLQVVHARAMRRRGWCVAIGCSGTIQALVMAGSCRGSNVFHADALAPLYQKWIACQQIDRFQSPHLSVDQCRLLPAGWVILAQIFEFFQIKTLLYSEDALLTGLFVEKMSIIEHPAWRYAGVTHLVACCRLDPLRIQRAMRYTQYLWHIKTTTFVLPHILFCAVTLQELGTVFNPLQSTPIGAQCIAHAQISGLSVLEKIQVAQLVQGHIDDLQSALHRDMLFIMRLSMIFMMLREDEFEAVHIHLSGSTWVIVLPGGGITGACMVLVLEHMRTAQVVWAQYGIFLDIHTRASS